MVQITKKVKDKRKVFHYKKHKKDLVISPSVIIK